MQNDPVLNPQAHPMEAGASANVFDVKAICFDEQGLALTLDADPDSITVAFEPPHVIGFRLLDEGDLLEFWGDYHLGNGWLYEVTAGGWLALESTRAGFLSQHRADLKEYLVVTQNACVSVLSTHVPSVQRDAA